MSASLAVRPLTSGLTIGRDPNDVDIVLWDEGESLDPEEVKQFIVHTDDRYFLKPSKRPGATYEILYCRLPGWRTDPDWRRIKVDILVAPGELGLPKIKSYEQNRIAGIPVMPLFALLIMKTKGWWDHRISSRWDFRAKERADVTDIDALLNRALEEEVSYQVEKYRYTSKFIRRGITLARKILYIRQLVLETPRCSWKSFRAFAIGDDRGNTSELGSIPTRLHSVFPSTEHETRDHHRSTIHISAKVSSVAPAKILACCTRRGAVDRVGAAIALTDYRVRHGAVIYGVTKGLQYFWTAGYSRFTY
ncbi:hypothetical protein EDB83DRAFT_2571340 [Lactarius deliciosus]|nr:hypothetical protein EDB83DRAFT_2571340 [Lactarius deliciosus]